MASIANTRPFLLVAGDSRANSHIMPTVLASHLQLPEQQAINMAFNACGSARTWAAYREFADRFAPNPIMVMSTSFRFVNDRSVIANEELVWSVNFLDRLKASPTLKQALLAAVLPERTLARRITDHLRNYDYHPHVSERGFEAKDPEKALIFTSEELEASVKLYTEKWIRDADITGVKWRQLEIDLKRLLAAGVQLVLVDTPEHPAFLDKMKGTYAGQVKTQFSQQLADLCRRLHIPFLHYEVADLTNEHPDLIFHDWIHLNRQGAALLSERLARDLAKLVSEGVLQIPENLTNPAPTSRG